MKNNRLIQYFCIIILVVLLIPDSAFSQKRGGRVVIALRGDAGILNPIIVSDNSSSMVSGLIFEGLVNWQKTDEGRKIIGGLAKSWDVSEILQLKLNADINNKDADKIISALKTKQNQNKEPILKNIVEIKKIDNSTIDIEFNKIYPQLGETINKILDSNLKFRVMPCYTFHLREDVYWHDGEKFDGYDVKFTYNKIMDPNTKSSSRADFSTIENLEVLTPNTIKVVYKTLFPKALEIWTIGIIPEHILKNEDITSSLFNRYPIGTGPFKFQEWAVNDYIILSANDKYYGGRPYLDEVVFRIIPNESYMFLELLAGNIDIMRMKPDQYKKASNNPMFHKAFVKKVVLEPEYTYVGYNLIRTLFKDVNVRRAITMAIDREEIVKEILLNFGTVVTGPFYKNNWAYDKSIKEIKYDPEAARKLLKKSGFEDINGDGILEKDMGTYYLEFSFTLMTNTGNKDRELTAQFIKKELKKIGIKVIVKYEEWTTFINKYIDVKNFDAILLAWGVSFDPDDTFAVWSSEEIPDIKNGKFGLNSTSFINKEVDELFKKGRITFDKKKRKEYYFKIHKIISELQPFTFLYSAQSLFAVSKRIKNVQINEVSIVQNINKWWIEK